MSALLMRVLITACDRLDLLEKTGRSLFENQQSDLSVVIHDDSLGYEITPIMPFDYQCVFTKGLKQHGSIEKYLKEHFAKYYLHCEDDWEFENSYDWIKKSVDIMENDPSIIKVICRSDSPHPCDFDEEKGYGILEPWRNSDGDLWCGFGWNPGVTRLDLIKKFIPFGKWEQDVSESVYKAGYRTALLSKGVCKHIGDGRSTHD